MGCGIRNILWLLKGKRDGRSNRVIEGVNYSWDLGGKG